MRKIINRILVVITCWSLLFTPSINFAALLDKDSPTYGTIDSIMSDLDKEGIDIARNLASPSLKTKNRMNRPVVGPLNTMDFEEKRSTGETAWTNEFKNGAIGAIVAIKENSGGPSLSFDDFKQKWEKVDKSKRVFISFTVADLWSMQIK